MKQGIRWGLYTLGMLVLALGLTLNTKTGLGVSPIISVAFGVSEIWGLNFGDLTFLLYGLFVAGQIALRQGERVADRPAPASPQPGVQPGAQCVQRGHPLPL